MQPTDSPDSPSVQWNVDTTPLKGSTLEPLGFLTRLIQRGDTPGASFCLEKALPPRSHLAQRVPAGATPPATLQRTRPF